jgi:hypothetical protein
MNSFINRAGCGDALLSAIQKMDPSHVLNAGLKKRAKRGRPKKKKDTKHAMAES